MLIEHLLCVRETGMSERDKFLSSWSSCSRGDRLYPNNKKEQTIDTSNNLGGFQGHYPGWGEKAIFKRLHTV